MAIKNPNGEMTRAHILVLIASCLMAWGVMGMLNAYGVFFTPMGEALGVGRAAVTLHLSIRTLVTGLAAPLAAFLLKKRVSPKKTMPFGMILYLVSSIVIAKSKSVILVDILAAVAGFGLSFISFMFITIILGNWFHKNLGTFSGIAIAFSGIGSAIASPVVTKMLSAMPYETVYILYAAITMLMVVPILFVPFWPQRVGLKPYGEGAPEEDAAKAKNKTATENLNLPYKVISGVSLILFLITLLLVGDTSLNSHLPSLAISNGFSAETGALLLSASMIGNLTFKLLLGVIIDRWGVIKGFLVVLTTTICGFVLILFSKGSVVPLLLGGYLYGTVFSIGSLGLSILTRYIYGNEQYNQVYSIITVLTSIGSASFVTIVGSMYDSTGSYRAPVIMGIVIAAVLFALVLILTILSKKEPKKAAETTEI
ncbi:MAG: MFS transporter [Firmicutes bacterium]|nr:MFS transporter [Bacillota bacterium]